MLHSSFLSRVSYCAFLACTALVWSTDGRAEVSNDQALRIILAPSDGTSSEDKEISRWQAKVSGPSPTQAEFDRLGWAFISKARRTQDAGFYKLAEETARLMEARFGANPESQLLRGHVLHNLHRFAEAEILARELVDKRGAPVDFALLSDCLMEQGKTDEAVAACQHFIDLKPGLEAYSRVAHLRWLTGDLPGAIEMMESAVRAGSPRQPEPLAWALTRLSSYHLQTGESELALLHADRAIQLAGGEYAPGFLAKGRALSALGRYEEATAILKRAADLNPLPEYQWWLADNLRASGHGADAEAIEALIKKRGGGSDPRTLAIFLATRHENLATAVELARAELEVRGDVLTHDAYAWALAASGDYKAADREMKAALVSHTKDARILFHAGEIALAQGHESEAQTYFSEAKPLAAALTPSEFTLLKNRSARATLAQAR